MSNGNTFIHVTHEAAGKIGGIGAVLHGFFTSNAYLDAVQRSIIVGPLFSTEGPVSHRLGSDGEVLYSSIDGYVKTGYHDAFRGIERHYNTGIVYGTRTFVDKQTGIKSTQEVILVDVRHMDKRPVDYFKSRMFERFGIKSNWYEHLWEYEQYVRLAPVTIDLLKALGAANENTTIVAHEFMGMPTALAAILDVNSKFKTMFYAHEVAPIRKIVEDHPGHDTMFYNVLKHSQENGLYINEVFGDQSHYFKHPLVEASRFCDVICAVGHYTAEELRFLSPEFDNANINIVYNGIPAYETSAFEKMKSKEKLQKYCETLIGFRPDYLFTHVTRLVPSKGLWRDIKVLEHIEKEFRMQNKTGVMILLSTEVCQRRSQDIHNMETAYNWPLAHREGWPDLSGGEASHYTLIQKFNAQSRNIKIIFMNQFGFNRNLCGRKMPEDLDLIDLRRGIDVEFGLSIYEPFGIAHLEGLTFGAICVCSNVSGCTGFVNDVTRGVEVKNEITADFVNMDNLDCLSMELLTQIDKAERHKIEEIVSSKLAMQICSRLPKTMAEVEDIARSGYEIAKNMSWDVVVENYLLPAMERAYRNKQEPQVVLSNN